MQQPHKPQGPVQSVTRAFEILGAFTIDRPNLSAAEIASILNLNRTTVHRILTTLEASDAVQRVPNSRKYTVGTQIARLSNVFYHQIDLRSVAMPILESLRASSNQTAGVHLRRDRHRMVIAQAESRQDLRVTYPEMGDPIPLHIGAPGKVILAHASGEEIESYVREVPLGTPVTNKAADSTSLLAELEQIREAGYSITSQERRLGVISIAAPIFNVSSEVIGSVNLSAPIQRVSDEQAREFATLVVDAGRTISARFGYHAELEAPGT